MIERPANTLAGTVDIGEDPMSVVFNLD